MTRSGGESALALIGLRGSGKSTVGRLVAARAGSPLRDLDAMVEARCGMEISRLFATRGEAAFRALEASLLPDALEPGAVAPLGGGTPVADANWATIRARAVTVWLDAPADVLLARLARDGCRPPLARGVDAGWAWLAPSEAALEARLARYGEADHRVDATGPAEAVAEEVLSLWAG
jgi:shikimate kinase